MVNPAPDAAGTASPARFRAASFLAPARITNVSLDRNSGSRCTAISAIRHNQHVEHNPRAPESVYRPVIEKLIAELMDATFEATDTDMKVRLASLELRARALLERWEVRGVN